MIVAKQAEAGHACNFPARAKAPQLRLWRAVADRRIGNVQIASPEAKWPAWAIANLNRPHSLLIVPRDGRPHSVVPVVVQ